MDTKHSCGFYFTRRHLVRLSLGPLCHLSDADELTAPSLHIVSLDNKSPLSVINLCSVVRADIPGVRKSDIHVDTHDGNVLRFGHNPDPERAVEDEKEEGIFLRAERVSTFRNRNLRMPEDADLEGDIRAKYHDGVLEIVVPKKKVELKAATRQIRLE